MFKTTNKSKIDPSNFGAGSILSLDKDRYLVVACADSVTLVDMQNFAIVSRYVTVSDVNHLTETEARALFNYAFDDATFSDANFDSRGFKE